MVILRWYQSLLPEARSRVGGNVALCRRTFVIYELRQKHK